MGGEGGSMITFELRECPYSGYITAMWIERIGTEVRQFSHQFKEELPIGAVFNLLLKHYETECEEVTTEGN